MVGLMSKEEADYCIRVVQELRMEVYNLNLDILVLDERLGDQLDPPVPLHQRTLIATKNCVVRKRNFCAKLIKDIREVLVEPPSLESRVIGYIVRILSFRYI